MALSTGPVPVHRCPSALAGRLPGVDSGVVDISRPDIGGLVLRHRDAAGLTQDELARRAGVHQGTLSAIERNSRDPTFTTLCRLLDVLDLQLELGVVDRAAAVDAAIDAAARRPVADRLRRRSFDGVDILDNLAAASPVVEGPAGAVLHGAPIDVVHVDVAVVRTEAPALRAGLRALASDRWSDRWRVFGPEDPDPLHPGAMRWMTISGEVRVRLVDTAPEAISVMVGHLPVRVRPLHEIEADDAHTARVLARLRERLAAS